VAYEAGRLQFLGDHAAVAHRPAFDAYLAPLHKIDWVVYCKKPFAGAAQVLQYLSRYIHRIAISNRRLISADRKRVTFMVKDYRDGKSLRTIAAIMQARGYKIGHVGVKQAINRKPNECA
jgi:hypothetical protein